MANGGRIQYTVGFNSDVSGLNRATQEIQKIQESLKAVKTINIQLATAGKAPEEIQKIIGELTEAKNAAALVETALKKSFNAKLNTFNITNFNNELKKSGTNITEIGQKLMKSGAVGAAAFRNIETQIGKVNLKVKQSNKLFDEMATTMMNSIKWGITSSIWNNMTGSIEKAWSFAKKLDSSLNNIRIVTDKSAQDMEKFAVQANKAAKNLGASTTGYTDASLIYYQQGLSDAEVQARTETTLKAANVTGQSAAEVSEQLTAVWNGYKVSAQEAELYVDKLSAVAATTAADLEELSTGMSKVASAANIMGVDIDQLNAQLATVVSVTRQAPEFVGTAFKTIYARMGDIEAGLDTETSLGEYTEKMNEMGFNVLDTNGKLKDMGSVIEEIGNKWTSLSREQQVALSQTMAGTRQYNNLLALFDNWDEYTKSLETSRGAAGSLQKQQDIYMESMEAHLQQLSTEGERVYNNLFNADTVNPLIDALTTLVSLLADFVDGIGGIGPLLLMIGSIGTKAFSKQIGEGIATSIINSKNAKRNAEELASQYQILDGIAQKFSGDLVGQQAAIDRSINSLARQGLITQERADELRQFSSALGEIGNRIDVLKIKQEEYNKVAEKGLGNAQQLDADNQGTTNTEELLKNISSQRQERKFEENPLSDTETLETALPAYGELNAVLDEQSNKIEETRENLKQMNAELEQNIADNSALTDTLQAQNKDISIAYSNQDFKKQLAHVNHNISEIEKQYNTFREDFTAEEQISFERTLARYKEQFKALREAGRNNTLSQEYVANFQKAAEEIQKEFESAIANGFDRGLENAEDAIDSIRQAAQQAAEGAVEQNQKDLSQAEEDADETQKNFKLEITNEQLKQITTSITNIVGGLGQIFSACQMIANIVSILNDDSASAEEKIKQIIPLLIAAIPMMITGISTIEAALPGAKAGIIALIAASKHLTIAEVEASVAAGGLGAAIWSALAPILPIILAVVAAVGLLVTAGVALYNAYNADAIAAKKAAEAAKEAASAAEKAKTAYEELANTIKGYDDAVDSLKELTQETQEYTEALEEANAKAIELISANAELANHVSRNSEGLLVFDESVKENVLEIARKQANQAQAASYLAQSQAGMAQNKSDITDLGREIVAHYKSSSGSSMRITAESVMPQIIKAIQEKGGGLTKEEISSISGINKHLIPAIQDHMAEIVKQTKATEILNQTNNVLKDEILRASLENNKNYANRSEAEKNVIATVYGEGIELSEDSGEYQKLVQEAETKYKDTWGDDSAMQKEYAQKMGYTHISDGVGEGVYMDAEGNEQKISDEIARTWLKQQYIAEQLANYNENELENISDMVDSMAVATKDFSQSTQDEILGVLAGDKEFDTSNLNKEDFDKLQGKSTNELKEMFKDVDFSSLGENGADIFIQNLQEGLNNLDWSKYHSSLVSSTTSALDDINSALKDFKLGEKLDDEVISTLESKFPELKRIWDKTSQEYYDALRKAQEETEEKLSTGYDKQSEYEYGEIGDKKEDYDEALSKFNKISSKSAKERFQEAYDNAYAEVATTAGAVIDAAGETYGSEKDKEGNYVFTKDKNVGTWMENEGASSETLIAYKNAKKYAGQLEEINSALRDETELTEEQKDLIDGEYNKALEDATNAANALKTEVEETFKADYELEISITNDLLSDVDEIVTKAENARTAVELIGEGFKVSAENSKELLTIFPELAHNAQVLADGTIQLDDEVIKEVLDNDTLERDSMTDVTATAIDNRIAELEADKAAMEAKLEDLHNTSVAEFNVQEFLGKNYQEFKEEEVNANALAAQDEVSNSALSAKAVIANWQAKINAAEVYAKVAAAAESPSHDTSQVENRDLQTFADQTVSSTDTTNSVNMTEEEKKQKEEELERINQELYNLTEDYLTNKIASDEKQIAQLTQSKSELYAGIKNIETAAEKDIETAATKDSVDLLKEDRDRYHDINVEIKKLTNNLEDLKTAEEHLTGKDLINNLNQQLKILDKTVARQREKLKIQKQEQKELQAQLKAQGVKFDKDGTIANYNAALDKKMQAVNDAIATYNSFQTKEEQEAYEETLEAIEKDYEEFKEKIERYEELVYDDMQDLEQEIADNISEQISLKIQTFDETVKIELDFTEAKKSWIEFKKELDLAESDIFGRSKFDIKSIKQLFEDIKTYQWSADTTIQDYKEGKAGSENSRFYVDGVFDEKAAMEALKEEQENLQNALLAANQKINEVQRSYLDMLDQVQEKLDKQMAGYEHINELINHGLKLTELLSGEDSYKEKSTYYSKMATNYKDQIDMASQEKELWNAEIKKAQDAVANATTDQEREIAQEQLDKVVENWRNATNELNSLVETAIENLKAQYENSIDQALQEMTEKFTNGKSLDYISKEWELINDNADRYLDTVNSTYEVQALEAKYMNAIDSTDSISAQKKLNKAMEEELTALREKDKLTQYDIDRANKKLDITMKQIALEEAQANKSTMRLRRDAQGNYSYQFVADEDEIAKAQQDLLAAQNDLYNFDKEAYEKNLDEAYQAYVQFQEDLKKAAMINDPEERAAQEALIREQYEQKITDLTAINETIRSNLQSSAFESLFGMYNTNEENFKLMNDDILADFSTLTIEDMPNLIGQLVEGWNTGIQQMITSFAGEGGFSAQCQTAYDAIKAAQDTYQTSLGELKTAAGTTFNDIESYIDNDIQKTKDLMTENNKLIDQLKNDLDKQWKLMSKTLAKLRRKYEKLEEAAKAALDEMMRIQDFEHKENTIIKDDNPTKDNQTSPNSPSNPANNNNNKDQDKGKKKQKDPSSDEVTGIAAAIWRDGNAAGWYNGATRYERLTEKFTSEGQKKIQSLLNRLPITNDKSKWTADQKKATDIVWSVPSRDLSKYYYDKFDTGGYTGEWGAEGRMAMLHEKEIVLNKQDTANILNAVSIVRGIGDLINNLSANLLGNLSQRTIDSTLGMRDFEQNVHITAEFPNVSSSSEIEDALRNLTNVAAQRAFSTRV